MILFQTFYGRFLARIEVLLFAKISYTNALVLQSTACTERVVRIKFPPDLYDIVYLSIANSGLVGFFNESPFLGFVGTIWASSGGNENVVDSNFGGNKRGHVSVRFENLKLAANNISLSKPRLPLRINKFV